MTEPVGGWNFTVTLQESASTTAIVATFTNLAAAPHGGFSECTGLESTMAVEEYREGGRNDTVLNFPGRIRWAPLRLRRGVLLSPDLWKWHHGFIEGKGVRRDGVITLRNDQGDPVRTWRFLRALPSKWTGPALNAGQNAIAIEELEITHEGVRGEAGGVVSEIAGAIGGIARAFGGG